MLEAVTLIYQMIQVFQNLLTKPDAIASSRITDYITMTVMTPSSEHTQHLTVCQAMFQAF